MPLPRLIPCLDVAAGRVVKGVRFEGLRDVGDPVELGAAYSDAGADELVFLDVRATVEDRYSLVELVARVADCLAIPFTVGGGVRSVGDAEELLAAGADKVSVNSAALARPALLTELAERLGSQAVVVAIDAAAGCVYSHAGSRRANRDAAEWAREAEDRGAGEVLLTSIDADGTRDGYDLVLTRAVSEAVSIPVIASGGAGNAAHVAEALSVAQAALLASILHENPARLEELRTELRSLGVPLREIGLGAGTISCRPPHDRRDSRDTRADLSASLESGFVGPPTQGGGPGGGARAHHPPGEPAPEGQGEPAGELRAVVVQDAASGRVLMLAWMDDEALRLTRATGEAHFWSRSRRRLWRKGATSGNTLSVQELREDCDGDAILLRVRAAGPVCHTGAYSCFAPWLWRVVASRAAERPTGSYVAQLLDAGIVSCARKVGEEAVEAALAATSESDERLVAEVADLWFHTYVLLASRGLDPAAVEKELERRHRTT